MPTYEFECEEGHITEQMHSMSKCPTEIECETCGKPAKKLLGTGGGIIFKGKGWPGQELTRRKEDESIGRKVKRARNLKATGKVPMEERIDLDDRKIQD